MVASRISVDVLYPEKQELDSEDNEQTSSVYEMRIFGKNVVVAIGQPKYTFSNKNIVYLPIYGIKKKKTNSKIGLFEMASEKVIQLFDENRDVVISKLPVPLLFSTVDEKFVASHSTSVDDYLKHMEHRVEIEEVPPVIDAVQLDERDLATQLILPKTMSLSHSLKSARDTLQHGIFSLEEGVTMPEQLPEETKQSADEIKSEYKESNRDVWIQKFMKNANYGIHEVEANGDCFFAVVRDAFQQIGQVTTVQKLRALLAGEMTDEIFQENRKLVLEIESRVSDYQKELEEIKKTNARLKKRMDSANLDRDEVAKINTEILRLKEVYKDTTAKKNNVNAFRAEVVGRMTGIDTLEKYREHIQTSSYWADTWAISTIERLLNIKMVILSERSYKERSFHTILDCGEANKEIQSKGSFSPKYYILTSHSGEHYNLITYKKKRILKFLEVPYYVKTMIIKSCMESNSGIFYMIQDFRNLKSKYGLEPDLGAPEDDEMKYSELYDPEVVFRFHSSAQKAPAPGKGTGEKIPIERIGDFVETLKSIPDWRRKLDDSWTGAPFSLDGKKWTSVEHYYQASKFSKKFPTFADQFSLDSNSEISKDVDLAKNAGNPKKSTLRPKEVVVDPEFENGANLVAREKALSAKFSQNVDMKQLLKATRNAKLVHYIPGNKSEPDILLMKQREL